jgi:hypothetical protein
MIIKLPVCIDDKILFNYFILNKENDNIILECFDIKYEKKIKKMKVPLCNNFEGISYIDIYFPYNIKIINDKLICNNFFEKVFLSHNQLEIDFFYNLEKITKSEFNLDFINKEDLKTLESKIWKYWVNYDDIITTENYELFLKNLWNVLKLYYNFSIYLIYLKPDFTNKTIKEYLKIHKLEKKILNLANVIKALKFSIYSSNEYIFNEHFIRLEDKKVKLSELKIGYKYFIKNLDGNKFFQIEIENINDNMIQTESQQVFIYNNYEWYFYICNLDLDFDTLIFYMMKNEKIYEELMERTNLKIESIHSKKIMEYYNKNNDCALIYFRKYFDNYTDFEILKRNNFSDEFFRYIAQKYSSSEQILDVLKILFSNYSYPIKQNKLEKNFDQIIYYSFYNIDNIFSKDNKFDKQMLENNIMDIVPQKLKMLYYNLCNLFYQISVKNNYQFLISNQKFYNDYLHRSIIKIMLSNSKLLTSVYILDKMTTIQLNKFISVIKNSYYIIDIINRLNWNNLPKRLSNLSFIYENKDLIFFIDKFNKNLIPENYDTRIKRVLEFPFEMFKYLKKDKDYIKWIKFLGNNINDLYYNPISLSTEDFTYLGKIIYLLINIKDQNIKDESYLKFINFSQKHNKLILDNTRINLKIKENFPFLKTNINLGFLAKHLTFNKEGSIDFEEENDVNTQDMINIEEELRKFKKKYQKYKMKYLQSKQDEDNEFPLSETSIK